MNSRTASFADYAFENFYLLAKKCLVKLVTGGKVSGNSYKLDVCRMPHDLPQKRQGIRRLDAHAAHSGIDFQMHPRASSHRRSARSDRSKRFVIRESKIQFVFEKRIDFIRRNAGKDEDGQRSQAP